MGQQQLLLIVLGVIVVGIAIAVGISLFNSNAINSNRDAVVSDLNNLGALAISHYKKPTTMGGGGQKFDGWTIPSTMATNPNGTYTAAVTTGTDGNVVITGVGTELADGTNYVTMVATVNKAGVISITKTW
jgi:hypothetical protein